MCVRITSADPASLLSVLSHKGIRLTEIESVSELTLQVNVRRTDFRVLLKEAKKREDRVEVIRRRGMFWRFQHLLKRPVLLAMLVLLFFGVIYLPGRVFFVRVEGNENIPTQLILTRAEACGVCFGASRREVRSEKMKNALLESIPELKWAGINTAGCVATISVTERTEISAARETATGVASIVAIRDGIVTDVTVTKGTPLCTVGQAVKAGEVLVSGYTDCGYKIQASTANAEIYGVTQRQLKVIMPANFAQKGESSETKRKISLQIGKNKINLYKDSGISPTGCDKMYTKIDWTLPGGFLLPVAWVVEEYCYYENDAQSADAFDGEARLREYAADYLSGQMLSGSVLAQSVHVVQDQNFYHLTAQYACRELIGKVQSEEIIQKYGEND